MIEFFNFVVEVFFWMVVFWFALQIFGGMFNRHVENRIEQLNAEIEEIKKVYKRVKIEEYHDTFYLFDADTDTFIGQGRTMKEIADKIRGEVVLNVMEGDPDVIQRFKQTFPQTDLA
jgi:hypothetical protein